MGDSTRDIEFVKAFAVEIRKYGFQEFGGD